MAGRVLDAFEAPLPDAPADRAPTARRRRCAAGSRATDVAVTVSVGVALATGDESDADLILRDADVAMYRAKQRGRGRFEVFDEAMRTDAVDRLSVENDLRRAIRQGQLRLFYQPIVHIDTGQIAGFEALVRWQHPVRGLLSPADFIPPAEDTGLIVPLGRCVLGEACLQAAAWQRRRGGRPAAADQRQRLGQAAGVPGMGGRGGGHPGRDRAGAQPPGAGDHRERPHGGRRGVGRPPRGAAPARRPGRHRRLRHRLLVPRLPPPPAGRRPQDRQVVHRRGGQGSPRVGPGPGRRQAGPHPRPRRGGRGRHRPPPAGRAAPAALPVRPGLLLLPAPAARGGRRAARAAVPAAADAASPGNRPPAPSAARR